MDDTIDKNLCDSPPLSFQVSVSGPAALDASVFTCLPGVTRHVCRGFACSMTEKSARVSSSQSTQKFVAFTSRSDNPFSSLGIFAVHNEIFTLNTIVLRTPHCRHRLLTKIQISMNGSCKGNTGALPCLKKYTEKSFVQSNVATLSLTKGAAESRRSSTDEFRSELSHATGYKKH